MDHQQDSIARITTLEQRRQAIIDAALNGIGGQGDLDLTILANAFLQGMAVLKEEAAAIAARIEELTTAGCIRATPYYRKDARGNPRYLFLIHPTAKDGSRRREYVGVDEEKKAQALAAVVRWQERERLKVELANRRSAYRAAIATLCQALRYVEQGWAYEHHSG